MVDEESRDVEPEAAGDAPTNKDKSGGTGAMESEVSSTDYCEATTPRAEASNQAQHAVSPGRGGPRTSGAFLSGALGGFMVAVIAVGGGYYLFSPKADIAEVDASRLAVIESQANRDDAAISALDKQIAALEGSGSAAALAAIDKRLDALKSPSADEASKIASSVQAVSGEVKDLRADIDAAKGEIPGLGARVAKLESGLPQAPAADLPGVTSRLDKIEAQLSAPKSESRVAPERPTAGDNPAAVAIVAAALRDRLVRGAPFPTEFAGLERLGVEPAKLAPLKVVIDGAPTDGALAAAFDGARSKVLDAAAPLEEHGGIADHFLAHLRSLVRVRNLNETAGDDPQALASRIDADCRRGDVTGALAAFAKLPEASRRAASAWAAAAESRWQPITPFSRSARQRSRTGGDRQALTESPCRAQPAGRSYTRRDDVSHLDPARRCGPRGLGRDVARRASGRGDGDLERGRVSNSR